MSLDLNQMLPQVDHLARAAVERAAAAREILPLAERDLKTIAQAPPDALLRDIAGAGVEWRGAVPTEEPPDARFPLPDHPARLAVIGADGSQMYPDRHASAFFLLMNIGSIVVHHGSGQTPSIFSRPQAFFEDADMYDERGLPPNTVLLDGRRDVAELRQLADLAGQLAPQPGLALLDNGLLLWVALQERDRNGPAVHRLLLEYLDLLARLHSIQTPIAGVIDRPRSSSVCLLTQLAGQGDASPQPGKRDRGLQVQLSDRMLFECRLANGERSARFSSSSPLNSEFKQAGHEIQFFYLKAGPQGQVLRIEIPAWVAGDPRLLDCVHAGVWEQCRTTGIPYVLVRAHELAVITRADRDWLDTLVSRRLLEHGLSPHISQKAQTKRWTSGERRRA
jgi:hypothetical protein